MKLIFSDEFNYEGAPDPMKWSFDVGNDWHNNEVQYYTDDIKNCYVKDGKLHIVALNEEKGTRRHTSARIHTYGKFSCTYGKIEMVAKLPQGIGSWPAFWMLPDDIREGVDWPLAGEIDIMEYSYGMDPREMHYSLHSELYNHVIGTQETLVAKIDGLAEDFNKYTCEWEENKISFYVDDVHQVTFHRDTRINGEPKEQGERAWPFDKNYHLILNLAVGGFFAGDKVDDSTLPFEYVIDYVKVWQKD